MIWFYTFFSQCAPPLNLEARLLREQRVIHRLRLVDDARRSKLHLIEDVPTDINALGNFGQHQAFGRHFEDRALGNDLGALAAMITPLRTG